MANIHPYLVFPGNTEAVFNFYKQVFDKEFCFFQRFRDMPDSDEKKQMSDDELEKVMHVAIQINPHCLLMGSDGCASDRDNIQVGGNICLSLHTLKESEAEDYFKALSEEGTVVMPLQKTFWNALFGICQDKFGVRWMVNHEYEPKSN